MGLERKTILKLLVSSSKAYSNELSQAEKIIESDDMLLDVQVKIINDIIPIIAFRGSDSMTDALVDAQTNTQNLSDYFSFISLKDDLLAHSGFLKSVANIYDKLKKELSDIDEYDLTGHSYGAGCQTIFQYVYFIDTGKKPRHSVAFGSPRVFAGDVSNFNNKMKLLRIQNFNDMITYIPSKSVNTIGATSMLVGGAMGAYGSKSSLGGTLGAITGGITGYGMSDNYIHVGEALILFPAKNTPYKLDDSIGEMLSIEGSENTGDKNYIVVPKGEDVLRNPLDINGFISGLIQGYLGGIGLNMLMTQSFPTTPQIHNFLNNEYGQTALGRLKLFLESTDMTVLQQKISTDLLSRVLRADIIAKRQSDRPLDVMGDISKMLQTQMATRTRSANLRGANLLQEIASSPKIVNIGDLKVNDLYAQLKRLGLSVTGTKPILLARLRENLPAGQQQIEWIDKWTKKLTGQVREAFFKIHWLYLANMAGFLAKSIETYTKVQGHLTQAYMDNISLLPYYLGELPADKGFSPMEKSEVETFSKGFAKSSKIISPEIIGFMPLMENLNQPIFVLF